MFCSIANNLQNHRETSPFKLCFCDFDRFRLTASDSALRSTSGNVPQSDNWLFDNKLQRCLLLLIPRVILEIRSSAFLRCLLMGRTRCSCGLVHSNPVSFRHRLLKLDGALKPRPCTSCKEDSFLEH